MSIQTNYRSFIIRSLTDTFGNATEIMKLLSSEKAEASLRKIITITDPSESVIDKNNLLGEIDLVEQFLPIQLPVDCINSNKKQPLNSCVIVNRKKAALNSLKSNVDMAKELQELAMMAFAEIVDILNEEIGRNDLNSMKVKEMLIKLKSYCKSVITKLRIQIKNLDLREQSYDVILKKLKSSRIMTGGKIGKFLRKSF